MTRPFTNMRTGMDTALDSALKVSPDDDDIILSVSSLSARPGDS